MREHVRGRLTSLQRKKQVRAKVLEKYGSDCFYCGISLGSYDVTLDHRHPASLGGAYTLENLVPACAGCNRKKKDLGVEEFRLVCYGESLAGSAFVSLTGLLRSEVALFTQVESAAMGFIARRIRDLHPTYLFAWELTHMDVVHLLASEAEKMAVRL